LSGKFREDLFYRINIVHISLPPLRERAEDIAVLAETFIRHFCAKHQRRVKKMSKEVINLLQTLPWPGNVRQLRNLIERLVVTSHGNLIEIDHLTPSLNTTRNLQKGFLIQPGMSLAQVEAELIRQTLLKVTSNRENAAKALGISRRSLQYKIRHYGLHRLSRAKRIPPGSSAP
jgi:transcriptional regulator with PAS, ATPase and Fis domain